DDNDVPDPGTIVESVLRLAPFIQGTCLILVSSQLPVGTTRDIAGQIARKDITFGYAPENLRLGKSIECFKNPDRVVIGLETMADRAMVTTLFAPFTNKIVWMRLESAEMTKHAINAFLAASVVFINEIATLCEYVGADTREVENGLKSEARIGPGA